MSVIIIKCKCGKGFPVNTWKHPNRTEVQCPFCRTPYKNSYFDNGWKPNEEWNKNKHKSQPFTIAAMRRAIAGAIRGLQRR